MKYFKFTQIDASTGISWAINQPISGPSMPNLPGLTNVINLAHDKIYFVGKVDDSAEADPSNHFFEITFQEYSRLLKDHAFHIINETKSTIYDQEKDFRKALFSNYDSSAITAGINKYDEAKSFLLDNTASAESLRLEAECRGITVQSLAEKIVLNHESFKLKDARVAGIRGKILDRLNNFTFNESDPDSSIEELLSVEPCGTVETDVIEDGVLVRKQVDRLIGKYTFNLLERYKNVS